MRWCLASGPNIPADLSRSGLLMRARLFARTLHARLGIRARRVLPCPLRVARAPRPILASAVSYGAPISLHACAAVSNPRWRHPRRLLPSVRVRERGPHWPQAPCSERVKRPARARRRPTAPERDHRPRSRSPPAPRGAVRDGVPCSVATPLTEWLNVGRALREWTRRHVRRRRGPAEPTPGLAADPIRLREPPGMPPPRLGCRPSGIECGQAPSTASRTPVVSRDAAPRMPSGSPSPRRRSTHAAGGFQHDARGNARGGSQRAFRAATAPFPSSTPLRGRTARAPGTHTRPRSTPVRSRADRAHR